MAHSCIILGCGRSGTSLTAGLLRQSGLHFGNRLWKARAANPQGFFEDRDVNKINEEILRQVFPFPRFVPRRIAEWLNWGPHFRHTLWLKNLPEAVDWTPSRRVNRGIRRLASRTPFAYKDPRFSYTLNAWRPFLPANCRFICVFRDPSVVATSIRNEVATAPYLRNIDMTIEEAVLVWTSMYLQILDHHCQDGDNWLFLAYPNLVNGSSIGALEQFLNARVDRSFLDSRLNRSSPAQVELPGATKDIYERLLALSGEGGARHV